MASKPGISERPTETFLVEWLDALGNWKKLGLFLNIRQAHIERIARENPHSEDDAKMALFSEWLRTSLKASWRDVIEALKKMNELTLADEIEQKLRIEPEQQRAPIDLNPQSLDPYEEEHVDVVKLRRALRRVLQRNFAIMESSLKDGLKPFAAHMFAKGVISEAVRDHPTYDGIMREFEAGMAFKKDKSQLEQYCHSLLESLSSQGGPMKSCADSLEGEWKDEAKKELNISLNLQ